MGPGPAGRAPEGAQGAGGARLPPSVSPFPGLVGPVPGSRLALGRELPRLSSCSFFGSPTRCPSPRARSGRRQGRAQAYPQEEALAGRPLVHGCLFHQAASGALGAGDPWCPCVGSLSRPAGLGAGLGRIMLLVPGSLKAGRVAFLLASGELCRGDGENGFAVAASVNVAVSFLRFRYKCSFRKGFEGC